MKKHYLLILIGALWTMLLNAQSYCGATAVALDEVKALSFEKAEQASWYKYTAAADMKIDGTVNSAYVAVEYLVVGGGCDSPIISEGFGEADMLWRKKDFSCSLKTGQTVYVGVEVADLGLGEGVTLLLKEGAEAVPGSDCSMPLAIYPDETITLAPGEEKYYTIVPDMTGLATFAISNADNLSVKTGYECSSLQWAMEYSNPVEVYAGEGLLIYCKNWAESGSETFKVTIAAAKPGDICGNPLAAVKGSNELATSVGQHWYSYTPTKDCVVELVVNSAQFKTESAYMDIYESCDAYMPMAPVYSSERYSSYRLSANQSYLIKFTVEQAFTQATIKFDLSETDIEQGQFCDVAIPTTIGTSFTLKKGMSSWYSFTPATSGHIEIDINWNAQIDPYLKKDCNDYQSTTLIKRDTKYTGSVTAGTTYMMYIPNDESTADVIVDWRMAASQEGDACSNPVGLTVNEKKAMQQGDEMWYKVVIAEDGDYIVAGSLGYGADFSYMIGNCDATLEGVALDYDTQLYQVQLSLKKDDVLLIHALCNMADGFATVYKMKAGDLPSNPIAITDGTITYDATLLSHRWYSYTPANDSIWIRNLKNGSSYVMAELYDSKAEDSFFSDLLVLKDENQSVIGYETSWGKDKVSKGTPYLIKIRGTVDPYTFEIASPVTQGIEDIYGESVSVLFDAATGNYRVILPKGNARISVYTTSGTLVNRFAVAEGEVVIEKEQLAAGIYLVKVECGRLNAVKRIIIE